MAATKGVRHHRFDMGTQATALDCIAEGRFSGGDTEVFAPLLGNLRNHDHFLVLADYADYIRSQNEVGNTWLDAPTWTRKSILNSARSGKFSSDRPITEYCDEIWNVGPVSVPD